MYKELENLNILKDMLIGNGVNDAINDYVDGLIEPIKNTLIKSLTEYEAIKKQKEELGCQLEVFVKALKNGIYYDDKFEHPVFILDKDNFKTKDYHLLVTGTIVYLKDYKKTWWLKKDKSE